jgi:hypothetical protein
MGLGFSKGGMLAGQQQVPNNFVNKTYDPECKWSYDEKLGGYPPVANDGKKDLGAYICPSTFRDLSDFVYSWPYDRFGEDKVWVADQELAVRNLPPVSSFPR